MEELISEGKCIFCDKTFNQRGIARHLFTHLKEKVANYNNQERGLSYLINVKADKMFLMLWVDGQTTYDELDYFLRDIWLECCGHMSSFIDKKLRNSLRNWSLMSFGSSSDDDLYPGELDKDNPIYESFIKGKKLEYRYDFGSTTILDIVLQEQIEMPAPEAIVLLSRNEPLKIMCHKCGKKTAINICTVHGWDEESLFCETCSEEHKKECEDFEDYAAMPVVNSPRMGVCAYEGGQIDTERDGIYQEIKK